MVRAELQFCSTIKFLIEASQITRSQHDEWFHDWWYWLKKIHYPKSLVDKLYVSGCKLWSGWVDVSKRQTLETLHIWTTDNTKTNNNIDKLVYLVQCCVVRVWVFCVSGLLTALQIAAIQDLSPIFRHSRFVSHARSVSRSLRHSMNDRVIWDAGCS